MEGGLALKDQIYYKLKSEILEGKIRIGERLKQEDIAKKMNSSRMPVREALSKLKEEGLIVWEPHCGAKVSFFDLEYLIEVYYLRKTLERVAVELAVPHLTGEDVNHLTKLNEEFEIAVSDDKHTEMIELNEKFHFTLYSYCGFNYLMEILEDLWQKFPRYTFDMVSGQGNRSSEEHNQIINEIRIGNAVKAGEKMKMHIENAQGNLVSTVSNTISD